MNDEQLTRLLDAAYDAPDPSPSPGFRRRVMAEVHDRAAVGPGLPWGRLAAQVGLVGAALVATLAWPAPPAAESSVSWGFPAALALLAALASELIAVAVGDGW